LRPRVLIAEPDGFSSRAVETLRRAADVDLERASRADLERAFQEYDVVWLRLAHRIDAELLGTAPRTKILATPVTGLDHIDLDACKARGVRVVSLKGEVEFLRHVRATAELTVALALALLRKLPAASRSVSDGRWDRDLFRGTELFERTAGIVGVGRLGAIVGGYFKAFGMQVIGYDPRPDRAPEITAWAESLAELLERADVVSLHVCYDATTRHLIDETALRAMKPTAIIINTSRGGVVDDRALLRALEERWIAGAALDVIEGEPNIGHGHPLVAYARRSTNLIITPHIGGNTEESFAKTELFLAERVVESLSTE
jgi:D-3-phosphoglycerate dehydrogenase / 2-oxoglutarate reductase